MRRALILLICLSTMACFSQSFIPHEVVEEKTKNSNFEKVNLFSLKNNSRSVLPQEVKDYSILELKKENLKSLLSTNFQNLELTIPSVDRSSLTLQLFEVRYDDAKIRTSTGKTIKSKKGKHYRGVIKGNEHSLVAISFFENDVMGFISDDRNNGNLVIGKLKDTQDEIIIYKDNDVLKKLEFNCGTISGGVNYSEEVLHDHDHSNQRALTDCVRFYYEVDNDIYIEKGSNNTNVVNYITGLHNQVAALYAAENINVLISEIYIWTTSSPYNGQTSSQMLTQFAAQNNGFVGNFGMLLSYKASGGIAYVNTICSNVSDYRLGFSSIFNTYSNVPTYSWSVNVVTHEFGHLFGSQHTHDCVWNGNNTAIDGCYTPSGCANPGLPPVGTGTIMSYCHTTGVGVNFANGFGSQPGNVIRNSVTNATCLTACPGNGPTCTDGIQNGAETGVDCGGPVCPPCPTNCTTNSGTLTITFDDYPSETSWNITNSNAVILYSGSNYSTPNTTINIPVCLPNACYTLNFFDSFNDGICCLYGNGSYNLTINGTSVASGGQFGASISHSFCLSSGSSCSDGIQNGNETGIDCGGSCGDPITTLSGNSSICISGTTSFTSNYTGTWASSNPSVATINSNGVVTGVSAGSATFTITSSGGCTSVSSVQITVNPNPVVAITGSNSICVGNNTSLSPSSGGTWTSSNPSVATVNNAGLVTAVGAGSATFTFTSNSGCVSNPTNTLTVISNPVVSLTSTSLCIGSSTTVSPSSGGTWASSNPTVATVSNSGTVTAISAGSATFTFTSNSGCVSNPTNTLTVISNPVVSLTSTSLCIGSSTTVSPSSGGTWASSNPTVATVSNSGTVTAISVGSATFTFTSNSGCVSNPTSVLTVNALPTVSVSGGNSMCAGTTKNLTPTSGGTWVSSNSAIATVTNAGVVTAIASASGNVTFTFTNTSSQCSASTPTITVNPKPTAAITGSNSICVNSTSTVTPTTGGTWVSSNNTIATVTNAGIITGVAAGSATFTFTSSSGCISNTTPIITIKALPTVTVSGGNSMCAGTTKNLTPTSGGTWVSSNSAIATVTNAGVVTAIATASGNVTFTFTNTTTQCSASTPTITVNPKPTAAITGSNSICVNSTSTVTPTTGGTWVSSNNAIATVTNAGIITGVAAGSATFTFTSSSGCISNATPAVTVNAKPTVSITGTSSICIGSTTNLSPTTGGTWTSSNNSIATVTNAGIVTGVAAGSVTFTFTSTAGCVSNATSTVTVSSCTGLGGYYFETGWDGWSDGGGDCARYSGTQSPEGTWSIQIRDNSGSSSAMTSPTYANGATFESMKVEFRFRMAGYETNEDFWLQYSSNNGTSWTTVKTWVRGTTYANGTIYNETVILNKPTWNLTNQARFRFVSDASADDDQVYIDAVVINGYATAQATGNTPQLRANLEESEENITYNVFPNPTSNFINVKLSSYEDEMDIVVKLYGMDGKVAYSTKIDSDFNKIDVSNLISGLYIIMIFEDDVIKSREKVFISR